MISHRSPTFPFQGDPRLLDQIKLIAQYDVPVDTGVNHLNFVFKMNQGENGASTGGGSSSSSNGGGSGAGVCATMAVSGSSSSGGSSSGTGAPSAAAAATTTTTTVAVAASSGQMALQATQPQAGKGSISV